MTNPNPLVGNESSPAASVAPAETSHLRRNLGLVARQGAAAHAEVVPPRYSEWTSPGPSSKRHPMSSGSPWATKSTD